MGVIVSTSAHPLRTLVPPRGSSGVLTMAKNKILIGIMILILIVGAALASYTMEIGPFEDDDDDDDDNGGGNGGIRDQPPVAVIAMDRSRTDVGEPLTFNGSGSYGRDADITEYRWYFGDGNRAEIMTANHSWNQPGTYNVTLTVTDSRGNTNTSFTLIGVSYRRNENGNTNGDTESFDYPMADMAARLFVNTTLENVGLNFGDNEVTVRLHFGDALIWEENATVGDDPVEVRFSSGTNLTAGTWQWELVVDEAALNCDLDWQVEVVILYGMSSD